MYTRKAQKKSRKHNTDIKSDSDSSLSSDSLGSDEDTSPDEVEDEFRIPQKYIERHYQIVEGLGLPTPPDSDEDAVCEGELKDVKVYNCEHYNNHCQIKAPCCNKVYKCWRCHNLEEDHALNKSDVKILICKNCDREQGVTSTCQNCGIVFGEYYCNQCVIFDNSKIDRFHCDECKSCIIANKNNTFHCDVCNCCLDKLLYKNHKCIQDRLSNDCPVCLDELRGQDNFLLICGHTLHKKCYDQLIKNSSKCPICSRTIKDMTLEFAKLDLEIEQINENNGNCEIYCNDCQQKCTTKYHSRGCKCIVCDSYNTYKTS